MAGGGEDWLVSYAIKTLGIYTDLGIYQSGSQLFSVGIICS